MSDDNFGPWIDWAGGPCPIPDAKEWQYIAHCTEFTAAAPACSTAYKSHWESGTITAYRLPADDLLRQAIEALRHADMFITNGVENGYIRLPSPPDPALETPKIIRAVLTAYDKREQS